MDSTESGLDRHRQQSPAKIRFAVVTISDTRDAASDKGGAFLAESIQGAGHVPIPGTIATPWTYCRGKSL